MSEGKVAIAFAVAVAKNGVIGRNGDLPWRIPGDLKQFRKLTMGKPVLMGRKTFQSIGKPLDGRDNIVITRDKMSPKPLSREAWLATDASSPNAGRTPALSRSVPMS